MADDYTFSVRFAVLGGHVHCRLFSRRDECEGWQPLGSFVASVGMEFISLVNSFERAQFVPDDGSAGIEEASMDLA
jgi:hypothetical protein